MRASRTFMALALLFPLALAFPLSAVELGSLVVQAEPGAEVIWQGVSLGRTDGDGVVEISQIPLGTYGIEIRATGRPAREFSVDAQAGNQTLDARPETSIPDPLQSSKGSLGAGYFLVGFSILVLGSLWMAHLHSRREQLAAEPDGPVLMVDAPADRARSSPEFYDEIKQRENALDERGAAAAGDPGRPVLVKDVTPDSRAEEEA